MSISAGSTFSKKAYCDGCFKEVEWTSASDEKDVFGTRIVVCPTCSKPIPVSKASVVVAESAASTS